MKKKVLHLFYFILFVTSISSCSKDHDDQDEPQNQYLVSSQLVAEVGADEIKSRLPQAAPLISSSVKAYKIAYKTEFPKGTSITASGLVIIPDKAPQTLTLLGYQHGTITTQDEAPSAYKPVGNMEAYLGGTIGASLAKGYIVVMPDYIGFGDSKQIQHLYQEKSSLASACLDMLKAAKEFADEKKLQTKKEIRLLGYSEGGYATMALHQAIQEQGDEWFKVEASYPAAGAYDMVGTAQWAVSRNEDLPQGATSFYLWTLLTYNNLYQLKIPLTDMIQPNHAAAVAQAISQGKPLAAPIPNNPHELFTTAFIQGIQNGTNMPFMAALERNNVYNWKPASPLTLFHAAADKIVPVLNAERAQQTMNALGGNVQFISLGNTGHREAIPNYITTVLARLAL
ncbi:MAG: alpha/beta hydrolase family protein [Arcticibacter sp.]